jgi:hypothetical protein
MLDWERSTLTHSSAGEVLLVLGLAVLASSVSALAVAWLVVDAEVRGQAELDGAADRGASLTLAEGDADRVSLAVAWPADEVPEGDVDADFAGDADADFAGDADADSDGDADADLEGDGDADSDGDADADLEGDGDEVACAGSAWHAESVAGVASGAACALTARPRVRTLPPSKVTAAALACAKRI